MSIRALFPHPSSSFLSLAFFYLSFLILCVLGLANSHTQRSRIPGLATYFQVKPFTFCINWCLHHVQQKSLCLHGTMGWLMVKGNPSTRTPTSGASSFGVSRSLIWEEKTTREKKGIGKCFE